MKVLVTGGAGYIGAAMVPMLVDQGYEVRVFDRFYFGKDVLRSVEDKVELCEGDVRWFDASVLDGIDAVIHLAAISSDPVADYNPERAWEVNHIGTIKLADACIERGIQRFTYASSCSIYGGVNIDRAQTEDDRVSPVWAYSESKYAGEEELLRRASDTFRPVILRQGSVYGFSTRLRGDMVVHAFLRDALIKGRLSVHGGGPMWLPLVDVGDVSQSHIHCLSLPLEQIGGKTFNVVHDNYQIGTIAKIVASTVEEVLGKHVEIIATPLPAKYRDYRASGDRIRCELGFDPSVSMEESVAHMLTCLDVENPHSLLHPRHYNMQWMDILQEAKGIVEGYPKV
jgi:nucleoside-diphosphate-sugar epimerase